MSRALARLRRPREIHCWSGPGAVSSRHPRARIARTGRVTSCRTEAVSTPGRELEAETARADLHAAHERRLRRELRSGADSSSRPEAPGVRLRFVQKSHKESTPLRDGSVDLETGVVETTTAQELRVQALFRDRLIGAVERSIFSAKERSRHPVMSLADNQRLAAGARQRADGRCLAGGRVNTGDRDDCRWVLNGARTGPSLGPDRHRS